MSNISVVIPVYNVESYINRCVDSLLDQSFTDFDLVLVDDGSLDNSGAICDEYEKKDKRICVIHKANGGLSDARNVGIEWALTNSNSEWITFIDSDDWVHPDYLRYLYRAVCENDVELSVVKFMKVNEVPVRHQEVYTCSLVPTEELFFFFFSNLIVAWCKLFNKTEFQNIRFPVGKIHEDEFTTYKILFNHNRIAYIEAPLYYYYNNTQSIMNKEWKLSRLDAIEAHQKQLVFFGKNNYKKAYEVTAKVLLFRCADAIENLRKYYYQKYWIRIKYFAYYYCVVRKYKRYLTRKQRKVVGAQVHPRISYFIKVINKKARNISEIIKVKK